MPIPARREPSAWRPASNINRLCDRLLLGLPLVDLHDVIEQLEGVGLFALEAVAADD